MQTKRKQRVWVVAPTFPLVREDWMTAEVLLRDAITDKKQTERRMDFQPYGFIEFKSADRGADGLIGAGLDGCIVDEAKLVSKEAWEQGLRPALADKKGRALFISTPKGRNYFYDLFLKGRNGTDKEWKSWQYPTNTNPYFPKSEWEVIRQTTPDMIFKQEYLADFLENEATVFKNIERCLRGTFEQPDDKEYYTVGVDLGKAEDFTVITVMKNKTCQVVDVYRMNQVDWSLQKKIILGFAKRYKHSLFYVDSTGLGDPIEEDLRASGVNTKDYKFTSASKQELIEQLIVAIEQGLIGIPVCVSTQFLIDELKAFSYDITKSGHVRYSAPEGLHDDGVISLGLATRGISSFLYHKKEQTKKAQRKTFQTWTADDMERYYDHIDSQHRLNPFMTKEQIENRLKRQKVERFFAGIR